MNSQNNTYHGSIKRFIKTENFNISLTIHEKNSVVSKHYHTKPNLCFLVSGMYEEEGQNSFILNSGSTIYRTANYEHSNQFFNTQGVCLNIEIDNPAEFINANETEFPNIEIERKGSIDVQRLLYLFGSGGSKDLIDIYCYESLNSHFEDYKINGKLKWVQLIKEFINDNPYENISLQNFSHKFQLHPNYIIRKFKEITGYKLSEYLTKVRIENSILEIINSEDNMTEIALNNGFFDQSHFNKNFKKYLNLTPTMYKDMLKRLV